MGTRQTELPGGLLIPARVTYSDMTAVGSTTTSSTYTEAAPRPGTNLPGSAYSKIRPAISGSQTASIGLRVIKAGMPTRDNGVQLGCRLSSSSTWLGWNPPNWTTGWTAVEWSDAVAYARFDAVTIPSTQQVLVVRRDGTALTATSRVITTSDRTVSASSASTMADATDWNYPALCILPGSERILCSFGGDLYYTDNLGTNWLAYAAGIVTESTTTFGRTRMAYCMSDILMLVEDTGTPSTTYQYASSDLGASFQLVATLAAWGTNNSIAVSDGGVIVGYCDNSTGDPMVRRLSSAFQSLSTADAVQVSAMTSAVAQVTIADPDGTLWCLATDSASGNTKAYWCPDSGETWSSMAQSDVFTGSATDYLTQFAGVSAMGGLVLLHNWVASTGNEDSSIGCYFLGGWHSLTGNEFANHPRQRYGFDVHWLPIELPQDGAVWALTGTAGTLTAAKMNISTAAATGYVGATAGGGTHQALTVLVELDVVSGGSLTASEVGVAVQLADNTYYYRCALCFTTAGWRLRDVNAGASIAPNVTIDMTTPLVVLLHVTAAGAVQTYYWRVGATTATTGPAGTLQDDGAGTNADIIRWGHVTATTSESNWRQFHYDSAAATTGSQPCVAITTIRGKPITSTPVPVPIIGVSPAVGYLSAMGGPGIMAETHTIDSAHDYSVDNVFPAISPSPSVKWRSTSTAEQILCFDLDAETLIGESVGLFVAGANFQTAYLESSANAGTSWQTEITLNLATGFEGLDSIRLGENLRPKTDSTITGGRYLFEGELRGGTVVLNGTAAAYRITHNTQGGWVASTTTVEPQLQLAGAAAGTVTDTDTDIRWPAGVGIQHTILDSTVRRRQHWRVRIPTGQTVAESYYEAGVIMFGRIVPFGARVAWGRSDEMSPNVLTERDSAGTTRATEQGTAPRSWSMHWQDVTNATKVRAGADVDYVGVSGKTPLAADDEVLYQLWGLIELLKSGEIPVVAIEEIPTTTGTTLTDRTRFLYGRLTGSARGNNVAGDLGSNEQTRVESISIEEIV